MKKIIFLSILAACFLVLFWSSTANYFFQDDFLLLHLADANSLGDVLLFFKPLPGFPYRPLATHFSYFILKSAFGLNPFAFHLATLSWFILNCFFVYGIYKLILKSEKLSLIGVFLYALSPVHYMTFFWVASFYFAQGATFFLAGFYFYLKSRTGVDKYAKCLSLAFYLLGSLTNEVVLVLPLVIFAYDYLYSRGKIKPGKLFKNQLPYLGMGFFLLSLRLLFAGLPRAADYTLKFDLSFFSSLQWYVLRAIGLPEGIRFISERYLIMILLVSFLVVFFAPLLFNPPARKSPAFQAGDGKRFRTGNNLGCGGFQPQQDTERFLDSKNLWPIRQESFNLRRLLSKENLKNLVFSLVWFIFTLSPFLFLPGHMSSYYLEISLVGFILLFLSLLSSAPVFSGATTTILPALSLIFYFLLSFFSLQSMQATHWVNRRGDFARKLSGEIQKQCSLANPEGRIFLSLPPDKHQEAEVVLYGDTAAKVICAGDYRVSYVE